MREIKFRAWYKAGNRNKGKMIYEGNLNFVTYDQRTEMFRMAYINGYELMQYTGLKDKNGKEIYEGDIVNLAMWNGEAYNWDTGVIKWHGPSSAFKWFYLLEDASDGSNYWLSQADRKGREVIGNIYENPELLK